MFGIEIEKGLNLELLQEAQAEILLDLIDNNRDYLRQWMFWVDGTRSVENTKGFIKSTLDQFSKGIGFQAGIFLENTLIGVCGYRPIDERNKIGKIGYWLDSQHQGKGIMTKSVLKIVDLGFDKLALNRIEINCAVDNGPSRAIAEQLGFIQDGIMREAERLYDHFQDIVVYSKLASAHKAV